MGVLVGDAAAEHVTVPLLHLLPAIRLEYHVRELGRGHAPSFHSTGPPRVGSTHEASPARSRHIDSTVTRRFERKWDTSGCVERETAELDRSLESVRRTRRVFRPGVMPEAVFA